MSSTRNDKQLLHNGFSIHVIPNVNRKNLFLSELGVIVIMCMID